MISCKKKSKKLSCINTYITIYFGVKQCGLLFDFILNFTSEKHNTQNLDGDKDLISN